MTKAQMIERYGIEWYEEYKARKNAECKERYNNNKNNQEFMEHRRITSNKRQKERYHTDPEYRNHVIESSSKFGANKRLNDQSYLEYHNDYYKEYRISDINSNGKPKDNIRKQSRYILFDKRHHTKLKDYQIHHCFGYDDPSKFIYIPKSLHAKIHQFLRDNNINADSNHYIYILVT